MNKCKHINDRLVKCDLEVGIPGDDLCIEHRMQAMGKLEDKDVACADNVFPSGSIREQKNGRGRFDLLPWNQITEVAKNFEYGSVRYGDRNWELGQPYSSFFNSAVRHMIAFSNRQNDEPHLARAVTNLLMLMEIDEMVHGTEELDTSLDDRRK